MLVLFKHFYNYNYSLSSYGQLTETSQRQFIQKEY